MTETELIAKVRERDTLLEEVFRCGLDGGESTASAIEDVERFDDKEKLPIKKLDNWAVVDLPMTPYDAPEVRRAALAGEWYYQGTHKSNQVTSMIVGVIGKYHVMTRSGSIYELQRVDPEWERLFPNAEERFFKSAPKL